MLNVNYKLINWSYKVSLTSLELSSTLFTGWMPTLLRAGRGMSLWDKASSDPPPEMLQLFSYENNSVLCFFFLFISCIQDFSCD